MKRRGGKEVRKKREKTKRETKKCKIDPTQF